MKVLRYLQTLHYQKAAKMVSSRFYPLYLQAKLYKEMGDWEKAIEMANLILTKKVKMSSTAISEMKTEMRNLLKNKPDAY